MNNDNYKKSDLLFISDFVFNGFTEDDYYLVKNQKENKNKFYSLIIGSTPMFSLKESFLITIGFMMLIPLRLKK